MSDIPTRNSRPTAVRARWTAPPAGGTQVIGGARARWPALAQAVRNFGLVPKTVTPRSSRHLARALRDAGMHLGFRRTEHDGGSLGHQRGDQPVPHHPAAGCEVEHRIVPADRSVWSASSFACWSRVPPAPCTMHLGTPVVPDAVHHVQRVVEGQGGERDLGSGSSLSSASPHSTAVAKTTVRSGASESRKGIDDHGARSSVDRICDLANAAPENRRASRRTV